MTKILAIFFRKSKIAVVSSLIKILKNLKKNQD